MPVGPSGRIVVELDPETKRRLRARLRADGLDFKSWLLEHIREYIGPSPKSEEPCSELSELEERVLEAVSADGQTQHHLDDLVQATGLDHGAIQEALLGLELQGRIVQHFGLYRRVRPS